MIGKFIRKRRADKQIQLLMEDLRKPLEEIETIREKIKYIKRYEEHKELRDAKVQLLNGYIKNIQTSDVDPILDKIDEWEAYVDR